MQAAQITVIIPTLADKKRSQCLLRAIASVRNQRNVSVEILVVINGQLFDPELLTRLESFAYIRILKLSHPSLANARYQGLLKVSTPYFSFLDDDDEYLPDSVRSRLKKLEENTNCLMVVSSGLREINGEYSKSAFNLSDSLKDPFGALEANNWMTSCGPIFRGELVRPNIFSDLPTYHEWTFLAYKLITMGPFCIVDEPCYVIHDTPGSMSKSEQYESAPSEVLREILKIDLPSDARRSVKRLLSNAEHDLASKALARGHRAEAFKHHLKSLLLPGGLKFILFSRYFIKSKKIC